VLVLYVSPFCYKGAFLADGQLVVAWDPQVLPCRAAFHLVIPQYVLYSVSVLRPLFIT